MNLYNHDDDVLLPSRELIELLREHTGEGLSLLYFQAKNKIPPKVWRYWRNHHPEIKELSDAYCKSKAGHRLGMIERSSK